MSKYYISFEPQKMYHIWTHANGEENLFRSDENYRYFLKKYDHHIHPFAETFAYCLMPNHFHLMVRIRGKKVVMEYLRLKLKTSFNDFQKYGGFSNVISQQFSNLLNGYTKAYNKKYDRKGSLFMPNFKRKIIDSDEYYTGMIVYIHNNPIHHNFVTDLVIGHIVVG
jgi:REP element-mobilizing transposase RayT